MIEEVNNILLTPTTEYLSVSIHRDSGEVVTFRKKMTKELAELYLYIAGEFLDRGLTLKAYDD